MQLRRIYGELINADEECVCIFPSTAFAMTLAARNVVSMNILCTGKKILLLEREMASAVYPWQQACLETGAELLVVPNPLLEGLSVTYTERILSSLNSDVAVVALPNVHWCDGTLIDLEAIADCIATMTANERPVLIVDATQSIGAKPLDVERIKPTFMACSVHKWLNGPYGLSLGYLAPQFHQLWQPLDQHERARLGSDESEWDEVNYMNSITGYPLAFMSGAKRLDAGGKPNPITIPMVLTALKLVCTWSVDAIQNQLESLMDHLMQSLQNTLGEYVILNARENQCHHILGVRIRNSNNELLRKVVEGLKRNDIHVSIRGECIRVSIYLHISIAKINRFVAIFTQLFYQLVTFSDSKKILVLGAAGWLSQFLWSGLLDVALRESFQLFGTYSSTIPDWVLDTNRFHLDLSDSLQIEQLLSMIKPDVIIHAAAISSPMICHNDPRKAASINCPKKLFEFVKAINPSCIFIFTSTDMVYAGDSPIYSHNAAPSPINIYGKTKSDFENYVTNLSNGFVLRLSNMIGPKYVYKPVGVKFLQFLQESMESRKVIGLKIDERRSFIYVEDVVSLILTIILRNSELQNGKQSGVFNVGGPVGLSRMELAKQLAEASSVQLAVTTEQEAKSNDSLEWKVFGISGISKTEKPNFPSTELMELLNSNNAIAELPLLSPIDITMDSSYTESFFGMKFLSIEDAMRFIG